MILGVDLSSYLDEASKGGRYYVDGVEVNPYFAFSKNGVSLARIRVWNDPFDEEGTPYGAGICDVPHLLESAKIAKEAGMDVFVDFHYSDFWVDPAKQTLPKKWANYSFDEVKDAIYDFTKSTLTLLKEQGIKMPAVQIGNEITNGMCWPLAKLEGEDGEREGFDKLAILLKAGIKAAKEVYPETKIVLHLENLSKLVKVVEWYSKIIAQGVDFDIIGMSYYPYWHGSIPNFFKNIDVLHEKFHKTIWIAEISYAFADRDYLEGEKGQLVVEASNLDKLGEPLPYPLTKEGQVAFFKEIMEGCKAHSIDALIYWEPAFIPVEGVGWASLNAQKYMGYTTFKDPRNEWANQNLFDYAGEATPAFYLFKN